MCGKCLARLRQLFVVTRSISEQQLRAHAATEGGPHCEHRGGAWLRRRRRRTQRRARRQRHKVVENVSSRLRSRAFAVVSNLQRRIRRRRRALWLSLARRRALGAARACLPPVVSARRRGGSLCPPWRPLGRPRVPAARAPRAASRAAPRAAAAIRDNNAKRRDGLVASALDADSACLATVAPALVRLVPMQSARVVKHGVQVSNLLGAELLLELAAFIEGQRVRHSSKRHCHRHTTTPHAEEHLRRKAAAKSLRLQLPAAVSLRLKRAVHHPAGCVVHEHGVAARHALRHSARAGGQAPDPAM